ncbi:hypothetical protein AUJ14_01255 [Candidatus Micrarchaeota archaeon CG1_02_55_22]|nr:MAG: hypothetical protein AUJ14_01255 [Candidatus Micrarchaeota archaeon CG1_02_55_22]
MALLDASVLIARFNARDVHHSRTNNIDFSNSIINAITYYEVANVMQKNVHDKGAVVKALQLMLDSTQVAIVTKQDLQAATHVFERHYPRLSLADAVLVAQAKSLNEELVTFDADLAKATKD